KKLANLSENEVITKTNKVGQGNFWTQENLKAGRTYYFYIRTINSYGKSVFVEASGVPVSLPTDIFDDLDNTVRETEAFKQLSEELKWNTESIAVLTNATYSLSTDVLRYSANAQAGITQLQQLRVSDNEAWAQDIKRVYASIEDNDKALRAEIKETQTSITELNKAFGQTTTEIRTELKITNDATNKRIDSTNQNLANTDKEVGRVRADVLTNKEAISETNKAMAKSEERIQVQLGEQQGMIEEKMQATFKQSGDGVVTHSINITIKHNGVSYNAAGQVISAQVKNGKLESYIGYNANNFAWYNPVNGKMELFMAVKNGQLFVKEAFLDKASIREMVLSESIRSDNYVPGKSGFIIDVKNNKLEMYGGNGGTTLTNQNLYVKDETGYNVVIIGDITNER
ncbi:phage tail tip fiber protein, partial [Proteus mirabilis]